MEGYTILEKLGEGGMGEVFRARHEPLRREVALKTILPELASDKESMQRFRRELKLLCGLSHPNIVSVFDGGVMAGRPYFVMELIEGLSLDARLREGGPLPVAEAAGLVRDAADALAYLHDRGIFHRDIKPRNLILTGQAPDRRLVLVDFGLARTAASRHLTRAGEVVGTLAYLAPEALELKGGAPQDLWALGVTAFEMVTGKVLFGARDPATVLAKIGTFDPAQLDGDLANLPPWFRRVVVACLQLDPEDRVSARDLRQLCDEGPGDPRSTALAAGDLPVTVRRWWRGPLPVGLILAGLVVGGLGVGGAFLAGIRSPPSPSLSPAPASGIAAVPVAPSVLPAFSWTRDLLCVASERSLLVDFQLDFAEPLEVRLAPRNGRRPPLILRRPADRPRFHEVFRGLEASACHDLSIHDAKGRVLLDAYPVRTRDSNHAERRREALSGMSVAGVRDVVVEQLVSQPDPELISPLESLLEGRPASELPLRRLTHVAAALREPRLTRRLLVHLDDPDPSMRLGLLGAAAACRITAGTADRAREWVSEADEPWALGEYARILGVEGRPDSAGRIAAVIERMPLWWLKPTLEAMVRCDRDVARDRFRRWLERDALAEGGAVGLALLGEVGDFRHLAETLARDPASELAAMIAMLLADHGGEGAASAVRARLARDRSPRLIWSAARLGVHLDPGTAGAPALAAPEAFSREAALGLIEEPDRATREGTMGQAAGEPGWSRDLATWRLGLWRVPAAIPTLAARAFAPGGDPDGLAVWALGRMGDAGLPADRVARLLEECGPGCTAPLFRQVLGLISAVRCDAARAFPVLERLQADRGTRFAVRELAQRLLEQEKSQPPTRLHSYVTMVTYQRTGIRLERGETLHLRGWGLHPSNDRNDGWSLFPDHPANVYPGPNPGVVLRLGAQELVLPGRDWTTMVAEEPGELLLTPVTRLYREQETPLEKLMPSVVLLEVLDPVRVRGSASAPNSPAGP